MSDTRLSPQATLELPDSATAAEAGCAFLRLLERAEFVPSSLHVQALNALCRISVPVDESAEVRKHEAAEVSAFATEYWSLPPGVRRARWEILCVWCVSHSRLRELEAGLDVEVTQLENADANELAGLFRELFVLPRRERAIRRTQWLAEHASEQPRWQIAMATLQQTHAGWLHLDSILTVSLKPEFDCALLVTAMKTPPLLRQNAEIDYEVRFAGFQQRVNEYRQTQPSYSVPISDPEPSGSRFLVCVLLMGLILLGVMVSRTTQQPTLPPITAFKDSAPRRNSLSLPERPKSPSSPPTVRAREEPKEVSPLRQSFTNAEWYTFLVYESQLQQGFVVPVPQEYHEWVRAGRPLPVIDSTNPSSKQP